MSRIELYEHNQTAYLACVELLSTEGKAAVIHPTGTGKSFIGFKLCEDNPDKTICWLSPSEYIFKTQLENLRKTRADVPENIKFFSYSKLLYLTDEEMSEINPDYIILDEFHRCGAEIWGERVEKLLDLFKTAPILGLSATNIRYLDNMRDMADELFDNNIASEMTLGEAIVRGILPAPHYVTALYTYEKDFENYEKKILNSRNPFVRKNGEEYLESLRRAIEKSEGLDEIFHKHINNSNSKFIVFCANREHMDEMISHVPEWFGRIDREPKIFTAYSADPETSKAFADFKAYSGDNLALLFCIDMLNEGVHVDDVDGVILFRPTASPIIFKQQIGRALCAGKSANPIIFDIVDNIGSLYSVGAIEEEMKAAIQRFYQHGEDSYIVNEQFHIYDEVREWRELFEELENHLSSSWDFMYEKAKEYYEVHGNLLTPKSYRTEEGLSLGAWINVQRNVYRGKTAGKLTSKQIEKLEAIGMEWHTLHERQWEKGISAAKAYYEKHKHLNVPKSYSTLSNWLIKQRVKYRNGELSEDEIAQLNALEMVWQPNDDAWETAFSAAEEYVRENNHLDIPVDYVTADGLKLGVWYRAQRNAYRKGALSEERRERLEKIGINWTSVKLRNWLSAYEQAKKYFDEYCTLDVSSDYVAENDFKLGIWILTQRNSYSKGNLTKKQIEMLEKIGMSWNRFDAQWETGYAAAEVYFKEKGNLDCPISYVTSDNFRLGSWLSSQRHKRKSGKLSSEQIERLVKIGIKWELAEEIWQENYEELKKFAEKNGHVNVPTDYVGENGKKLASWLNNMKTRYRTGKLSAERARKLEQLGVKLTNTSDSRLKNKRTGTFKSEIIVQTAI